MLEEKIHILPLPTSLNAYAPQHHLIIRDADTPTRKLCNVPAGVAVRYRRVWRMAIEGDPEERIAESWYIMKKVDFYKTIIVIVGRWTDATV